MGFFVTVDNATLNELIEDNQIKSVVIDPIAHQQTIVKTILNVASARTCTIVCLEDALVNFWTFHESTCDCIQISWETLNHYLNSDLISEPIFLKTDKKEALSFVAFGEFEDVDTPPTPTYRNKERIEYYRYLSR